MANTTNLNLEKPLGTDQALVSVINSNSDKIDSWAGSTNQALSNKANKSEIRIENTAITSMNDLIAWFNTNKIGVVRVNNTVGNLLSGGKTRQGVVYGFQTSAEYIGFSYTDSNGDFYSGYITTATGAVTVVPITEERTIFVQLVNQTFDGSATTMGTTTLDMSSHIPSGYQLWSAEVQIQEGSSYYNLPWFNAGLTQVTFIEKIGNASITIRNKASWSENTRATVVLHCKRS